VRDNRYKIKLSRYKNISTILNVVDLTTYIEDEDEGIEDLRANPLQERRLIYSKLQNPTF